MADRNIKYYKKVVNKKSLRKNISMYARVGHLIKKYFCDGIIANLLFFM